MRPPDESDTHDTEQRISKNLDILSEKFGFCFSVVNIEEVEHRFHRGDTTQLSVLSSAEIQHLKQLQLQKNAVQWVAGRYAVKTAFFKYKLMSGSLMDLNCIDILKGANSAPYLLQYPSLNISITHSFPLCIGVVSKKEIGIDMEKIFMPSDSLIRYYYNNNEKNRLNRCQNAEEYGKQAMIFWTRKEAVSKLYRLGMNMNFGELDTSKDKLNLSCIQGSEVELVSFHCNDFCVSIAVR